MDIATRARVETSKGHTFYFAFIYKTKKLKCNSYDTNKGWNIAQKIADFHGMELKGMDTEIDQDRYLIDPNKIIMVAGSQYCKGLKYYKVYGNYAILNELRVCLAYHSI